MKTWKEYTPDQKRNLVVVAVIGFAAVFYFNYQHAQKLENEVKQQFVIPTNPANQPNLKPQTPGNTPFKLNDIAPQPERNLFKPGPVTPSQPATGNKSPVFTIQHIFDKNLNMETGTYLLPTGWQSQNNVDWQGSPLQPARITVQAVGPKGENFIRLPDWAPQQSEIYGCKFSNGDELIQFILPKTGLTSLSKVVEINMVHQVQLPGATVNTFSIILDGKMQGMDARVLVNATVCFQQDLPFGVIAGLQPTILAAPAGQLESALTKLTIIASSGRLNPQWACAYLKIMQGNTNGIQESVAYAQASQEKCAHAWDQYIKGVSSYPINGTDYELPYAHNYYLQGDTVWVDTPQGEKIDPRPLPLN
jgi:hypothetical protein